MFVKKLSHLIQWIILEKKRTRFRIGSHLEKTVCMKIVRVLILRILRIDLDQPKLVPTEKKTRKN